MVKIVNGEIVPDNYKVPVQEALPKSEPHAPAPTADFPPRRLPRQRTFFEQRHVIFGQHVRTKHLLLVAALALMLFGLNGMVILGCILLFGSSAYANQLLHGSAAPAGTSAQAGPAPGSRASLGDAAASFVSSIFSPHAAGPPAPDGQDGDDGDVAAPRGPPSDRRPRFGSLGSLNQRR